MKSPKTNKAFGVLPTPGTARHQHWQQVYDRKFPQTMSWFQGTPSQSLEYVAQIGIDRSAAVIDVGAGASRLVDHLLLMGFTDVSVLDISETALAHIWQRLDSAAGRVQWHVCDVTEFKPVRQYALWHDRAVLHFLMDPDDREKYMLALKTALQPGGHVILATFAIDGPRHCSGLETRQYDAATMTDLLGGEFVLIDTCIEVHQTPAGSVQNFSYFLFRFSLSQSTNSG